MLCSGFNQIFAEACWPWIQAQQLKIYTLILYSFDNFFLHHLASTTKSSDDCVFPFKYRGKTYDKCTKVRHNQLWCSKDAVYKGRWKNCKGLCHDKNNAKFFGVKGKSNQFSSSFWLFHDGGRYHIETKRTGFYIITASVMKELM